MGSRTGHLVGRRWLLMQTGRGALGIAVLGLAGCRGTSSDPTSNPASNVSSNPSNGGAGSPSAAGSAEPDQLTWERVDLGFVAAYVLVRGKEAAVVDTGVAGSADAIGTALDEAGPGWDGVRHVVLTHKHADHAGSIGEVLTRANRATAYAGAADLAAVDAPGLRPLGDGEDVFGLRAIATPGHTAGHLAVFDADTGVLVAGDALTNQAGLAGSSPQFTEDEAAADESVRKLARLAPRIILVGHGEPVLDGAADALERLADSLG